MKLSSVIFFIAIILSCGEKKDNKLSLQPYAMRMLGIADHNGDVDSLDDGQTIINDLNFSKLYNAYKMVNALKGEELTYNGYVGKYSDSYYLNYFLYRYYECIGDLDRNSLSRILLSGTRNISNDISYTHIERIELVYLSYNHQNYQQIIDSLSFYQNIYPNSLRIKYLLANIYLESGRFSSAKILYRDLIDKNYYKYNCLRKLIKYYCDKGRLDSCEFFARVSETHFPDFCIPEKMLISSSVDKHCDDNKICESGFSRKDSIISRVYLCRRLLETNKVQKVLKFYADYRRENPEFVLDSVKIWERGQYFDIRARCFFLQKEYQSLVQFLLKEVGYNNEIVIEHESDLRRLISSYFFEYNKNASMNDFETFYKKNFLNRYNRVRSRNI